MEAPASDAPAPAPQDWFESSSGAAASSEAGGDSSAGGGGTTAADPQNAVTNAAAGMLGAAVLDKVPGLRTGINKVSSALNLSEHYKQLNYGPWGDFLMPSGGYKRPNAAELRGKVMTNLSSYGGCAPTRPPPPAAPPARPLASGPAHSAARRSAAGTT